LEWSASFLCADPFAHDIVETNVSKTTLYDKGEISLVNDGDARVNPYFEISTNNPIPLTVTMINHSTGERITPKKTIIRGDRLVIDSERRSMTKNGVEIDYAGGFPQLASGSNKFAFTIPPFGPVLGLYLEGFINVSARWRNKYL
jgi:phage-related protein